MKQPASYEVLKYWKAIPLDMPFHTEHMIIPETKVRSDTMPNMQFKAICAAVKATPGVSWMHYTINKEVIEVSPDQKKS